MRVTIKAPAINEPVTLTSVKAYCKVTHNLEDTLLASLIASARGLAEQHLRLPLSPQTFLAEYRHPTVANLFGLRESVDDPDGIATGFKLPRYPVRSVTSITLIGMGRADKALTAGTDYTFTEDGRVRWLNPLPLRDGYTTMEVEFVAGYPLVDVLDGEGAVVGQTVNLPEQMRQVILELVAHLWMHRGDEQTSALPPKIKGMLAGMANVGGGYAG